MKKQLYIRGCAWYNDARGARCTYRGRGMPEGQYYGVGSRCCFSPSFVIKRKVK